MSTGRSTPLHFGTLAPGPFVPRRHEPITIGVPLAKGACGQPGMLSVLDTHGRPVPLQVKALDRWPDGSIRWALLDFQANLASATDHYTLVLNAAAASAVPPRAAVVCRLEGTSVRVETGAMSLRLRRGGAELFEAVDVGGVPAIAANESGFSVEHPDGPCSVEIDRLEIEDAGPMRAVVRARGRVGLPASAALDLDLRLHCFAGSATVRVDATIRNPRAAVHPGGFWELGDPGSVYLRDVAFRVTMAHGATVARAWYSEHRDASLRAAALPLEIYQESSGGERWQHPNHRNRHGIVPLRWRGYRVCTASGESRGDRATPIAGVESSTCALAMTLPAFWQNFPKALEVSGSSVVLRLFPGQSADVHELQGGEQKTHSFYVAFGADRVTDVPLDWCRAPLHATLSPAWYAASRAVPYLTPRPAAASDPHARLIDAALDPVAGFVARREVIDEYGWRNFGDLYADHEAAGSPDGELVSHYNNQYDAVAGFALQLLRTGDVRWWELMDDLARHVADIDVYHTSGDKSAYNHGLFWHTIHYTDAGRATHRSYPRVPGVPGGGPSNEHNYASGLMLHYFLTGDPISRETALGLAGWVIAMDDGRRTPFRWVTTSATGLASQTRATDYHGPGRGAGHSIRALLDGHQLSGDAAFLRKAEELIRRVVHPDDDIDALNLLDAEQRWSYTACLQAIGAYLDYKAEHCQLDERYAYARESLLHFAAWMADHEYPYLERPERLEFPTETWAAQDLRKSDVFYFAARHCDGEPRARFIERGEFFFGKAVATLTALPTRSYTRPVVLLLSHGTLQPWASAGGVTAAERGARAHGAFPPRTGFVPQKERARQRVALAAGAAGFAATAALIGF